MGFIITYPLKCRENLICANHLRQLCLSMEMYAGNYDRWYPVRIPYVFDNVVQLSPYGSVLFGEKYMKPKTLSCPADLDATRFKNLEHTYGFFLANAEFGAAFFGAGATGIIAFKGEQLGNLETRGGGEFKNRGVDTMFWFGDSYDTVEKKQASTIVHAFPRRSVANRHAGRTNIAFVGEHVESLQSDYFKTPPLQFGVTDVTLLFGVTDVTELR